NKKTASHLSVNVSKNLQPLLSTEVSTVETPAIDNNNKETTSLLSTDIFERLQYLLNTEVLTVVVKTSAINIESDSDNLSSLLTTKVLMITDLELTNTQSNLNFHRDKTKCHDMAPDIAAIMVGNGHEVNLTSCDILLRTHDGNLQRISEFHLLYNPLHYILLFSKAYIQLQDFNDASDVSAVIEHKALTRLENILLLSRKSLKDFPDMPIPPITSNISNNKE
ncbi:20118_t:CDS:2, partial [Racocetra persica]